MAGIGSKVVWKAAVGVAGGAEVGDLSKRSPDWAPCGVLQAESLISDHNSQGAAVVDSCVKLFLPRDICSPDNPLTSPGKSSHGEREASAFDAG